MWDEKENRGRGGRPTARTDRRVGVTTGPCNGGDAPGGQPVDARSCSCSGLTDCAARPAAPRRAGVGVRQKVRPRWRGLWKPDERWRKRRGGGLAPRSANERGPSRLVVDLRTTGPRAGRGRGSCSDENLWRGRNYNTSAVLSLARIINTTKSCRASTSLHHDPSTASLTRRPTRVVTT